MENIIVNENISEVSIIIDNQGPNLSPFSELLKKLNLNYDKFENAANNIHANSAAYLNLDEINQLTVIQSASSSWQETYQEVDTIQQNLSSGWQNNTVFIDTGIIDAGYF
jgi:hypothetical protein